MSGAWLNCVIFSLRVSFTRYSQQDVLLTHPNKFPFLQAKGVISTALVGWFSRALTCFARSNIHIKNYSAIARRKNIPFYPARTGINFSYFQLARRSFRFPSQLICQGFFSQLAQILPDERVFCRAAPSGTPVLLVLHEILEFCLIKIWSLMLKLRNMLCRLLLSVQYKKDLEILNVGFNQMFGSYTGNGARRLL